MQINVVQGNVLGFGHHFFTMTGLEMLVNFKMQGMKTGRKGMFWSVVKSESGELQVTTPTGEFFAVVDRNVTSEMQTLFNALKNATFL